MLDEYITKKLDIYGIDKDDNKLYIKLIISCIINKDFDCLNRISDIIGINKIDLMNSPTTIIKYNDVDTYRLENFLEVWGDFIKKSYTKKELNILKDYINNNINLEILQHDACEYCDFIKMTQIGKCSLQCINNINGYCEKSSNNDVLLERILKKSTGETEYVVKNTMLKLTSAMLSNYFSKSNKIKLKETGCILCGNAVVNDEFCPTCIKTKSLIGCELEKRFLIPIKQLIITLNELFSISDFATFLNISKTEYFEILSALKIPYPENEIQQFLSKNQKSFRSHLLFLNYYDENLLDKTLYKKLLSFQKMSKIKMYI